MKPALARFDAGFLGAWQALSDHPLEANPFFAPAIALPAIEHLGSGDEQLAAAFAADGRLLALAPIRPARLGRIAPAIAVWTHLYGPLGTPLFDPEAADEAASGLVKEMEAAEPGRGGILLFPDLPLEGPVALALERYAASRGRPVARIGSRARAHFPARQTELPFRQSIDRRRRKELARQWRRLAELGEPSFRRIRAAGPLAEAAEAFLALEASGWKGRQGTALAASPGSRGFARAVLASAPGGTTTIDELRLDGRPVAMLASLSAGDLVVTWKIAHDEQFARFSPGVQLIIQASEHWLDDDRVTRVDSLAAEAHPMIDALWPGRMRIGLLVLGPAGVSPLFRAAVALERAEAAARRKLREHRRKRQAQPKPEAAS